MEEMSSNTGRPATQEQIENLKNCTLLTIKSLYKEISMDLLFNEALKDDRLSDILALVDKRYLENLIKVHSNVCSKLMSLNVQARNSLRVTLDVEKQYNLKHTVVDTHELYKYLYGFKQSTTMWKELKQVLVMFYPQECKDIDDAAEEYRCKYALDEDKTLRDVSEHYSNNPQEFYENISLVNERAVMDRLLALLRFAQPIHSLLVKELIEKMGVVYTVAYLREIPSQTFDFIGKLNVELDKVMADGLVHYNGLIDSVMSKMSVAGVVKEKMDIDITKDPNWALLAQNNITLHILYIYLDTMSIFRAFAGSEDFAEKRLNLAYFQMSAHEGFKKLYGFNDRDKEKSFWNRAIKAELQKLQDENMNQTMARIEERLETLSKNDYIKDNNIVTVLTHSGPNKNGVEAPFAILDSFRQQVKKEDLDALTEFLHLMNEIVRFNNGVMHLENKISIKKTTDSLEEMKQMILDVESKVLAGLKDPDQITQWKESMDKMKAVFSDFERLLG